MVAALGAISTAFYAYAFTHAASMVDQPEVAIEDRAMWVAHWQFFTGLYATLGVLLLVGGCLILARNSTGALVAAAAIFLSGIASWVIKAVGFARFPFEEPNMVESIILIGLSGFMLLLFLRRALWNPPREDPTGERK